jgi:hypothetical protein
MGIRVHCEDAIFQHEVASMSQRICHLDGMPQMSMVQRLAGKIIAFFVQN